MRTPSPFLLLVLLAGCLPPPQAPQNAAEDSQTGDNGTTERVSAKAGVGKEGQTLKGRDGPLLTPVNAYFSAKQKVVFDIQIPKAMGLYEALNGHAPKSHREFMRGIVIKLPPLPDGHRYIYDPDKGELMVERPKSEK